MKNILDFAEILEAASDYKLLQARSSKAYVQLMVDICASLNACELGRLQNVDAGELQSQTGPLLHYRIKGVDETIPLDVSHLQQLYCHFRKPTILVLRRIQKFLSGEHRRFLASLEREQALERIIDLGEFDVNKKLESAHKEMKRYQAMAELVRGGGRKLDILMQAVHVPGRTRFQLLTIDRIMRDEFHLRHQEVLAWLHKARIGDGPQALHGLIQNGLSVLDNLAAKVWVQMEELSGIEMPRDSGKFDMRRNWYALGESLPRGEDFLKTFTDDETVVLKIKRLTYPMVRVDWDAGKLTVARDRIILDVNLLKIQASQLANLTFKMEEKIITATDPKGPVAVAIQVDFDNGMLSVKERDEALAWVRENKIKVQDLILETYDTLLEIQEKNPAVVLPGELQAVIERIKLGLEGDRQSSRKSILDQLEQLNILDLEELILGLEQRLGVPDHQLLNDLNETTRKIEQRIDMVSIRNISFHKRVRDAFEDFSIYEKKVLELYEMEERLEILRYKVENWMVDCYGKTNYSQVSENLLDRCLALVIDRSLIRIRKLELDAIDTNSFAIRHQKIAQMGGRNCLVHLHQLLRECMAVPRPEQLMDMLRDWERDLGSQEFQKKEVCILENNEKLEALVDTIRAELREKIEESDGKGLSMRMRFEVYGLADWQADTLQSLFDRLNAKLGRIADVAQADELVHALQALEAQVITAQKNTRPNSDTYKRLTTMGEKGLINKELMHRWDNDLSLNFRALDQLLEDICQAIKKIRLIQKHHGVEHDISYLDVTINISDIERLKEVYDFVEDVTMDDTRRFCVAYNLKTGLLNDLVERVRQKDATIPREIRQLFNRKTHETYREKRFLPLPLRTAILTTSKGVFEAECQLLCHTLNLVKAESVRKKATYLAMTSVLAQAENADHLTAKLLRMLWGRIQKHLFGYKPVNHSKNYEGNRQALMTDVRELFE